MAKCLYWVSTDCHGRDNHKCPLDCKRYPAKTKRKPRLVKVKGWAAFVGKEIAAINIKDCAYKIPCFILIDKKYFPEKRTEFVEHMKHLRRSLEEMKWR